MSFFIVVSISVAVVLLFTVAAVFVVVAVAVVFVAVVVVVVCVLSKKSDLLIQGMGWLLHIQSQMTRRLTLGACFTTTTMKEKLICPRHGPARVG